MHSPDSNIYKQRTINERAKPLVKYVNQKKFWIPVVALLFFYIAIRGSVKHGSAALFLITLGILLESKNLLLSVQMPRWGYVFLGAIVFITSAFRYYFFNDCGDVDFSCYTNVLWNTLNGNFMYQSFLEQNFLALHSSELLLGFVPFFFLFGNYGLLLSQTMCWVLALYLIFSIPHKNCRPPLIVVIAIALSPCLLPAPFFGFHVDILFLPIAAWALRSYTHNRFIQFLIAICMMPLIKEVFALPVFMFGIIALIDKKSKKWIVSPLLISIGLSVIFWFFLVPLLHHKQSHTFAPLLPQTSYGALAQLFSRNSLIYFLTLLLAYGPMCFLGKIKWLLFPVGLMIFYCAIPDPSFREIWRHYSAPIGFLLLFPLAFATTEALKKISYPCFVIALCSFPIWIDLFKPDTQAFKQHEHVTTITESIPKDKSLLVHGRFLAYTAQRSKIANWIYKPKSWATFDYIVIDTSFKPSWWDRKDSLKVDISRLTTQSGYSLIQSNREILVFKKSM